MLTMVATEEDEGKRLDVAAHERFPQFSRSRLQEWIKAGRVALNGAPWTRASQPLRAGDRVAIEPAEPPPLRAVAEDIPLAVLYEDNDVVAVDKPAGMVVHAGAGVHAGTLVNALLHRFASLSSLGGALRPGIVHRLDRYTSGVLLVAKNDAAHQALARQFAARQVGKVYLALVHGAPKANTGHIDKPVARDPARRARMTARLAAGRSAVSDYRVLERYAGYALLEVRIGTGRTHQIRVHLASIGHPVVGDRLYGAPAQSGLGRYFLHAHRIAFRLPSTGEPIKIQSPLPAQLARWLEALPPLA